MREKLQQYVQLLFAGAADCEDIQQEILQNTLDRYDDLISEGKVPEAAYRLAITGIGDINEILGSQPQTAASSPATIAERKEQDHDHRKKLLRSAGVGLYILSAIPLFLLSERNRSTLGLCGTLCIVAAATVLMMLGSKKDVQPQETKESSPETELRSSIDTMIWTVGLAIYLLLSFATKAWHITWLVFPICGAVQGLIKAIQDYKEAAEHET